MNNKNVFSKVLFIGPQYKNYNGGMGAVLNTYSKQIKNMKFISVYHGHYGKFQNGLYFLRAFIRFLWKLLTDDTIQIIHLHGASRGSFYRMYIIFFSAKFIFSKKVIYHLHGGEFHIFYENANKIVQKAIQHLMRKTNFVICLSDYWYQYLENNFEIQKLGILNNPVNPPICVNHKTVQKQLKVLFLGLIGKEKGIFDLLEVLADNREAFKDKLKLNIGGNGQTDKLKIIIKKHKLDSSVQFLGWIKEDEKHRLLSTSDILILPSYNEGLPISILEAMSYGLAVISTRVGGIPEVIKEGENGYLITPGDKNQLGISLDKFVRTPDIVRKMGKISKFKIKDYFTSNVLKKLNDIYLTVIND